MSPCPRRSWTKELFEDGKMFDGSSIAGWKGIQESDMVLMPDPDSAVLDPFTDETTLNLRCNVLDPLTMTGYERCARSLAATRDCLHAVHRNCRRRPTSVPSPSSSSLTR